MSDTVTKIGYEGRIIRVLEKHLPDGRIHETALRPPGTRIIIHRLSDGCILLNREIRLDVGEDIRLPGGKISETNADWDKIKDSPDLNKIIADSAAKETREEAGVDPKNLKLLHVSTTGAPTMKHDLYYLVATEFADLNRQHLTEDEKIIPTWFPAKEVIEMCLTGKIQEGRSVAVLLQYLHSVGLFQK